MTGSGIDAVASDKKKRMEEEAKVGLCYKLFRIIITVYSNHIQ